MPAPAAAIKLLAAATFFPKTVAVRRTLKQAGSEPEERSEFIFHILVFLFQPPYVSGSRNTRDQIGDACTATNGFQNIKMPRMMVRTDRSSVYHHPS
jgi:hypothetical protein